MGLGWVSIEPINIKIVGLRVNELPTKKIGHKTAEIINDVENPKVEPWVMITYNLHVDNFYKFPAHMQNMTVVTKDGIKYWLINLRMRHSDGIFLLHHNFESWKAPSRQLVKRLISSLSGQ